MMYCVAGNDGIPFYEQPHNGYTLEEAIERVGREIEECVILFGGKPEDYKNDFIIYDEKFNEVQFKASVK